MPFLDTLLGWDILPDACLRAGIRRLLARRIREERAPDAAGRERRAQAFADELRTLPVAVETRAANAQHYEVPTGFYQLCLGPRLKYSSCWYETGRETLADGQDILELGCGWGSLTLWMAEKYPNARITAVSNSATQRAHIESVCRARGFGHVRVITCDMNTFDAGAAAHDRIVSVEMFEHMKNWEELLRRCASWLRPGGKLFLHVFTHRDAPYHFAAKGADDWMSRHFFTGGIMPSNDLAGRFQRDLRLEAQWEVPGRHYGQTSEHWLENLDRHRAEALALFAATYPPGEARKWVAYWRIFFMSCAELWNYRTGEWMVCHYRFTR